MILSALESMEVTSANPTHINKLIQVNNIDIQDLDATLKAEIERVVKEISQGEGSIKDTKALQTEKSKAIKLERDVNKSRKKLIKLDEGNVGELTRFSSNQMGNLKAFASNPTGFIMGNMMRKFAKGAGVLLLAALIMEAVKFIMDEFTKPGRLLDRRFKRVASDEILAFRRREEKQRIKQGFARVIITSSARLRGGAGQTYDTLRQISRGEAIYPSDTFVTENPRGPPLSFGKSTGLILPISKMA
jgi:hypothetical protein